MTKDRPTFLNQSSPFIRTQALAQNTLIPYIAFDSFNSLVSCLDPNSPFLISDSLAVTASSCYTPMAASNRLIDLTRESDSEDQARVSPTGISSLMCLLRIRISFISVLSQIHHHLLVGILPHIYHFSFCFFLGYFFSYFGIGLQICLFI
jgi:hypothetical protein